MKEGEVGNWPPYSHLPEFGLLYLADLLLFTFHSLVFFCIYIVPHPVFCCNQWQRGCGGLILF